MIKRQNRWQLQEAKNKLSEVVRRAQTEGPQTITVRGEDAVVLTTAPTGLMSAESHDSLFAFFQGSPAAGIEFVVPPLGDSPEREFFLDELFED